MRIQTLDQGREEVARRKRLDGLPRDLRAYVADLRQRAEKAGPQAYAYTYRHVADEIEQRFLAPSTTVGGPVYACVVCGATGTLAGPPFLCGKCFAGRDENDQLREEP